MFRNRLATETSAKLVFCFRMLRGDRENKSEAGMSMTDDDDVLLLACSCEDSKTETQSVNSSGHLIDSTTNLESEPDDGVLSLLTRTSNNYSSVGLH